MKVKVIACTYWFNSSSGSGTYETLQYVDGTTSCGCPGWTRRVDANGARSCKHTRMVESGQGKQMAARYHEQQSVDPSQVGTKPGAKADVIMPALGERSLL